MYSSALGNSRSSDCHHLRTTFEHGLQETKSEATKKSLEMPFEMVRTFLKLFSILAEISLDNLLVRPQFDRETFAEADSFGEYVRCSSYMGVVFLTGGSSFEKARATGDLHSAEENLRRFFEQRFNDGSDS